MVYKKKKRQLDRDHLKSNPTQRSHKWSRGNNTNSLTKGFATQQNQKAYMRAFRERRCFKCLAKDHRKYQCRESFRCFQCGGYGHKAGSCRTITKEKPSIKPNTNPARKRTPDISYSAILKHNKNQTDLHKTNNETMEPFWEERPEEMEVYCATRDYLRPQNEFLESTGMIVMMRGAQIPDMEREIARYFARTFGWLWQDYEVSSAAEAHFMVICPGENIRNALVRANPHTLRPGVQFTVHEWTPDWNMVIDPPLCEAWVRLIGLPVQAWNIIELKKFTTKMGKITAVLPFGREAGHFRHITLKIACEDPRRISRFAKYREGNRATRVRIRLLDWRVRQPGPFPLHPDHWGHGPPGDNRRPRRRHYQPPPPPPPQQQQPNSQSGTTTEGPNQSSSDGSNSVHPPRRTQVKEPGREEGKAMTAQKQLVNEEPLMAVTPTITRGVTLSIPTGEEATVNLIPGKMLISYLGTTVELLLQKGEICPSGQVSLNYDKNGGELPEIEVQGMITHTQDNSEFTPQTEVLDTPQTEALDNPQTEVLDSQDLPWRAH